MTKVSKGFDRKILEGWLNERPVDVALVIAARSAQRVAPMLAGLFNNKLEAPDSILLPLFRAMALPLAAARYPARSNEMWAATSTAATRAAAASGAFTTADAARAAADAATAAAVSADAFAAFATAADDAFAAFAAVATAANRASADAAATATAAAATASTASVSALEADLDHIESTVSSFGLAETPLWPDNQIPDEVYKEWENLKSRLLSLGRDWEVWTGWYEDRLSGRPAQNVALEVASVTLPEAMWAEGPALVNSTIRELTDLAEEGGDEAVDRRMEELRHEFSEAPVESEGTSEEDAEPSESVPAARNVWLLQYNPDQWSPTGAFQKGEALWWKTRKALPRDLEPGDLVIYWRTKKTGGVVGTGTVLSNELSPKDEDDWSGFQTKVLEFDESRLVPRTEAIEAAGIDRKYWQGAVLDLPEDQAVRLNEFLVSRGWQPFLSDAPDPVQDAFLDIDDVARQRITGEISMRRDDAERDHDALGRAPLAMALAWALHEIWCDVQGLGDGADRHSQEEAPGFVAHVDAPWGGGKTSFANLIARTLHPGLDDKVPEFLQKRYPDRTDMSGLFLAAAHEKGGLVENERAKYDRTARRPWIIVPYNAWLNQHVDPPWWSFYQTIRKVCFRAIREEGCPEVVQKGDGSYRNRQESWFDRFDRWRGLWVRELWWRLTTPKVAIQLVIAGASFVVGYLLYQFGIVAAGSDKAVVATTSGIGVVLALITGSGSFVVAAVTVLADALAPGRNALGERVALGSTDPLRRFRRHFARMMQAVERPVLVIIDDIDRCEPKFVVEMTRGLQTILKSPRVVYLLLGDRNWIEQAFEVCHEDMNKIDVGAEHTFGGRFVEKAIQLSFILPSISGKKEDYVREVLTGRRSGSAGGAAAPPAGDQNAAAEANGTSRPNAPAGGTVEDGGKPEARSGETSGDFPAEVSPDELLRVRREMSQARTAQEISAVGAEQSKTVGGDRALKRAVREEAVLRRAAQREEVEEAIRHWLQPLARFLPGNPRHIKRIINAVFMYQNSLLLTEEDYDEADFGGEQWRQLVIGVVLMVGYPNSWSILSRHPDWVEPLSAGLETLPASGSPDKETLEAYKKLQRNTNFVELLSKTELRNSDGEVQETHITEETVRWLNDLIPLNAH
ncbi:P-loop NTPase fold protein [Roseibium sp.]|uniref:P-loop NTPase fold protein n=1 Tax=Roseibium sp. TaxID=1936156 RepID=UPI003BAD5156